jgi:hypothetical protein
MIHENIKTLDHRFDNWGWGTNTNGTPRCIRCIDFDGDELDTIELEKEDAES